MRYQWTFITILSIWVAIAIPMYGEAPLNAAGLYCAGVITSVILAIIGFQNPE